MLADIPSRYWSWPPPSWCATVRFAPAYLLVLAAARFSAEKRILRHVAHRMDVLDDAAFEAVNVHQL